MSTGYQSTAGAVRQGSMSSAQWAAYLKQQQMLRNSYNQAYIDLQSAAQNEGLNTERPTFKMGMSAEEAGNKLSDYASNINSQLSYFDVDTQLNTLYKTAVKNGVTGITRPTTYGKTIKDSTSAQTILDNYTSYLNKQALQQGFRSAVADLKAQAEAQGVKIYTIPERDIEDLTEAEANRLITEYVAEINSKISGKAYSTAIASVVAQANAAGVYSTAPVIAGNTSAEEAEKIIDNYATRVNQLILEKEVTTQLNSIKAQAQALGVNIATPSANGVTSTTAQAVIDAYTVKVNQAILTKQVTETLQSIKAQAANYGVNVALPSLSNLTEDTAQATVDAYLSKVNSALESKSAAASNVSTGAVSGATGKYYVYDELGRKYSITEAQAKLLAKYQNNNTANNTYNYIPEEVANSGSNWWINAQGFYEWTPVTASDKAHLAEINSQRARNGLTAWKTLQTSAAETSSYKAWEEETAHQDQRNNEKTNGEIQLDALKADSAVSITNTAQTRKAVIIPAVKAVAAGELDTITGASNPNSGKITHYSSTLTASELKQAAKEYEVELATGYGPTGSSSVFHNDNYDAYQKQVAKDIAALAVQRANYKEVTLKNGQIVDAIQKVGATSTGENNIVVYRTNSKGLVVAISGTAKEYNTKLAAFKAIASNPISVYTSAADKNLIQQARTYVSQRIPSMSSTYSKLDLNALKTLASKNVSLEAAPTRTFKTKQEVADAEEIAASTGNSLTLALAKADVAFRSAFSWNNAVKATSNTIDAINIETSKHIGKYIPSLDDFVAGRDAWLASKNVTLEANGNKVSYNLGSVQKNIQAKLNSNSYIKAALEKEAGVYDLAKEKPATAAAAIVSFYASGLIAGVAIEGGIALVEAGAGSVAAATESALIRKAATSVALNTGTAVRGLMTADLTYEGGKTVMSGDAAATVDFITSLAIGGIGYRRGAKIIKDPIAAIPGVERVTLQAVSSGHDTGVQDFTLGESLKVAGKTILSRSAETGKLTTEELKLSPTKFREYEYGKWGKSTKNIVETESGVKNYSTEVGAEWQEGGFKNRVIQTFNAKDTANFVSTVEQASKLNAEIFTAGKAIADAVYVQKKAVTNPKSIEILSKNVPESAKATVKQALVEYNKLKGSSLKVYGSVSQALQMQGFMSRVPKDLEIMVGSTAKFLTSFKTTAAKAGMVEGKDFRISGETTDAPKVEFKSGNKWVKAIEVFEDTKIPKSLEKSLYRSESGIAFGFESKKPISVEGLKTAKLSEQGARKFAGATTLQNGDLVPVHPGRTKDITDFIEIGTAYEVTGKTKVASELIAYASKQASKSPEVAENSFVNYISKRERIPTRKGVSALASQKFEATEKYLTAKRAEGETSRVLRGLRSTDKSITEESVTQDTLKTDVSNTVNKLLETSKKSNKNSPEYMFRRNTQLGQSSLSDSALSQRELLYSSEDASVASKAALKQSMSELSKRAGINNSESIMSKNASKIVAGLSVSVASLSDALSKPASFSGIQLKIASLSRIRNNESSKVDFNAKYNSKSNSKASNTQESASKITGGSKKIQKINNNSSVKRVTTESSIGSKTRKDTSTESVSVKSKKIESTKSESIKTQGSKNIKSKQIKTKIIPPNTVDVSTPSKLIEIIKIKKKYSDDIINNEKKQIDKKKQKETINLHRRLQNVLGSLDSILYA